MTCLSASGKSKREPLNVTPGLCQEQTLLYSHFVNFFNELAAEGPLLLTELLSNGAVGETLGASAQFLHQNAF